MVQSVITITAFILVAIMLLGCAISEFIGSKKIKRLAMAYGICVGCLLTVGALGACFWLVISFILSPSTTWNYIVSREKIWLKEDLALLPPAILGLAFLFGSWWIFEKGNVIAKLRGVLCPKCCENSKYLLKETKSFVVVVQILLFLALLVIVGHLFLCWIHFIYPLGWLE